MKKTYVVRTIILAGSLLLQLSPLCFRSHGAAGDVDLAFAPDLGVNAKVNAVAVQPDGKMIIGGTRMTGGVLQSPGLVRLNADGSVDATFTVNPNTGFADVSAIVLLSNGKLLVGYNYGIIRLNSDGSPDPSFIQPTILDDDLGYAYVGVIVVQSDGKILIGGYFGFVSDAYRAGIARLNADGSLDSSFDPGFGVSAPYYPSVSSIALQPDGKVLIGGNFNLVDGTNRNGIARLNGNGSLDSSFDPGTGVGNGFANIASVALQPDGRVLIGGSFNHVNGTNLNNIARLHADGSVDNSFNSGTGTFGVTSVVLQSNGKMLIGGDPIARLHADGSLDGTFVPAPGPYPWIIALAVQSDGKVLIGGADIYGNVPDHKVLTRLYGDPVEPYLNIARSGALVIVSWPVTSLNLQLQETTDLSLPNSWTPVAQPAATNGNQVSVNIPTMIGRKFFRLKSQ